MTQKSAHHLFENLSQYNIILASQSPRRQQLLTELGLHFSTLVKPDINETFPKEMSIEKIPEYLAIHKAKAYHNEIKQQNTIVITADTIVAINNKVLGKPGSPSEAYEMLTVLSGCCHQVITGVAITSAQKQVTFSAATNVWFKQLSHSEINHYIDNYKPFDKAGGYGIQEWIGLIGIEKVEGSYFNVVGLPVQKLYTELLKF